MAHGPKVYIHVYLLRQSFGTATMTFREVFEPRDEKTCFMPYANNKGADQPAHPRNLISAFDFAAQLV